MKALLDPSSWVNLDQESPHDRHGPLDRRLLVIAGLALVAQQCHYSPIAISSALAGRSSNGQYDTHIIFILL